jgi:hypothetical protein
MEWSLPRKCNIKNKKKSEGVTLISFQTTTNPEEVDAQMDVSSYGLRDICDKGSG